MIHRAKLLLNAEKMNRCSAPSSGSSSFMKQNSHPCKTKRCYDVMSVLTGISLPPCWSETYFISVFSARSVLAVLYKSAWQQLSIFSIQLPFCEITSTAESTLKVPKTTGVQYKMVMFYNKHAKDHKTKHFHCINRTNNNFFQPFCDNTGTSQCSSSCTTMLFCRLAMRVTALL